MKKALIIVAVVAVAMLALAAPAMAEGYNNGSYNFTSGTNKAAYGANAGIYVADPLGATQVQSFSGPHGGYTTTTNKCQDCHSTHYATGSYMLLRNNSRETACDFCHVGGGGSETNIQMDNNYNTSVAVAGGADSVISDPSMGKGTGHTLGYAGQAPAGINPAFAAAGGLACFDCHSPHGNSARIMGTFGAPGDIAGVGKIKDVLLDATLLDTMMYNFTGQDFTPAVVGNYAGINIDNAAIPDPPVPVWADYSAFVTDVGAYRTAAHGLGITDNMITGMGYTWQNVAFAQALGFPTGLPAGLMPLAGAVATDGQGFFGSYHVYWGIDQDKGNIVTKFYNFPGVDPYTGFMGMGAMPTQGTPPGNWAGYQSRIEIWKKPLFPKGRFMLLKNPNNQNGLGEAGDLVVGTTPGVGADAGTKKMAINWSFPDGPDATWGPLSMSGQKDKFPLQFPWAQAGLSMENEFCADCHDGAAGNSKQQAKVWFPNQADNGLTGTYILAYSHDSQPKGCARQQVFNPNNKDNFGPHCRNCHTGAGSCNQCHGPDVVADAGMSRKNWESYWGSNDVVSQYTAWDATLTSGPAGNHIGLEGKSTYIPPAYIKANAIADINGQCIDGGFSYPHRTLGANMLKDSLYGVDFDGTKLAFGATRGAISKYPSGIAAYFGSTTNAYFGRTDVNYPESGANYSSLINSKVENLDSVCIDCHGNATTWNPNATVDRMYFPSNFDVSGVTPPNHVTGWELLLKGLP